MLVTGFQHVMIIFSNSAENRDNKTASTIVCVALRSLMFKRSLENMLDELVSFSVFASSYLAFWICFLYGTHLLRIILLKIIWQSTSLNVMHCLVQFLVETSLCLHCFDTVSSVSGRAFGLWKWSDYWFYLSGQTDEQKFSLRGVQCVKYVKKWLETKRKFLFGNSWCVVWKRHPKVTATKTTIKHFSQ